MYITDFSTIKIYGYKITSIQAKAQTNIKSYRAEQKIINWHFYDVYGFCLQQGKPMIVHFWLPLWYSLTFIYLQRFEP